MLWEAVWQHVTEMGGIAWVLFIDMTAAFHTVDRKKLYIKLYKMTREAVGVAGQEDKGYGEWLNALWAIVGKTKLRMRVNGRCCKGTETTQGANGGSNNVTNVVYLQH